MENANPTQLQISEFSILMAIWVANSLWLQNRQAKNRQNKSETSIVCLNIRHKFPSTHQSKGKYQPNGAFPRSYACVLHVKCHMRHDARNTTRWTTLVNEAEKIRNVAASFGVGIRRVGNCLTLTFLPLCFSVAVACACIGLALCLYEWLCVCCWVLPRFACFPACDANFPSPNPHLRRRVEIISFIVVFFCCCYCWYLC